MNINQHYGSKGHHHTDALYSKTRNTNSATFLLIELDIIVKSWTKYSITLTKENVGNVKYPITGKEI